MLAEAANSLVSERLSYFIGMSLIILTLGSHTDRISYDLLLLDFCITWRFVLVHRTVCAISQ